jgi:hypothetical protein
MFATHRLGHPSPSRQRFGRLRLLNSARPSLQITRQISIIGSF